MLLLGFAVSYVLLQLTILQPPVAEPNILDKRLSRVYQEIDIQPITALPVARVGEAALYHRVALGKKPALLLPDLGTAAWDFEKFLSQWKSVDAYALSYRGGLGAAPTTQANLDEYITDSRVALESLARGSSQKPVLIGQGMGALIALKIAQDTPDMIGGLVLIAPYAPRDWSDQQLWMVQTIGNWAYGAAFKGGEDAKTFWIANFPSGFIQTKLAAEILKKYAVKKDPFEYRGVIDDVNFTKLGWLDAAYTSLERAKFNVLHVIARYDTINPIFAQRQLRKRLETALGARYRTVILNSGKYVSLDWKWQKAASSIEAFVRDGNLPANVIENESVLDAVTQDPPDK